MRRLQWSFALLLVVVVNASPAFAGMNQGGTAFLSWDPEGSLSTRSDPPEGRFPVYLQLRNAPDVRALAVNLHWFPLDSLGQCYQLVPADADTGCGWATDVPPQGDFEGDSTYTWTIAFPPLSAQRGCAAFWFSAETCGGMVKMPKFVVAHRAPGSNLILWGYNGTETDTLVSYAGKIAEFYVGANRWSGHGSVYFDVYAGSLYLGRTPDIEVRSLDVDSLVVGAVDAFDVQAVVARLGQNEPAWFDFDNNGVIGPEDSTAVGDHRNHGGGGPLLAPNGGEMLAPGDSTLIRWVAGRGDSARVTVRLERNYSPEYETIAQDIQDSGELAWVVDAPDAPRADYRVRIIRTAGVKLPDDSNVYGYDNSDGRFTISGGTLGVEPPVPVAYSLYAGRPNPGHHSVSFRFDLPVQADVRFEIFDLQGRRLRRFVENYGPGRHEWVWDLRNHGGQRVGAGIYFCRFAAGPFTAQNRLVVLR